MDGVAHVTRSPDPVADGRILALRRLTTCEAGIDLERAAATRSTDETPKGRTKAMNRLLSSRSILSLLLLLLTAGVVFLLTGCPRTTPGDGAADTSETGPEAAYDDGDEEPTSETQVYEVRGVIQELPDPQDPLSGLYIRHEAIDDWVGMDGEIQPMDAMTMPFPVSEDVTFEGIATGDKVTFTLEVNYDADPAVQVTEMTRLPEDTELDFRDARAPE